MTIRKFLSQLKSQKGIALTELLVGIAITGHHDCAGNPASKPEQMKQIEQAVKNIAKRFRELPIVGLWIDENWQVSEIASYTP